MDPKYKLGEFVYLVHDPEQHARQVTAIVFRETGLLYELSVGMEASGHQDLEISRERNMLVSLGIEVGKSKTGE